MSTTLSARLGGGGIQKRTGGGRAARVDQDGDLDMDAPSKGRGARGGRRGGARSININNAPKGPAAERTGSGSGVAARSRGTKASGKSRASTTRKSGRAPEIPLIGVKVWGWKQSKGSAEECVRFLERKTNTKFRKTQKQGEYLIVYVPPAGVQSVLDWDKAKFAGVNLKITSDTLETFSFNHTMQDATPKDSDTSKTIAVLEEVLRNRYDPQTLTLDLSNLGEDALLKKNGFFQLGSTTSKMFPALMAVANKKFTSEQAKRDAIVSVSLANNMLTSVAPVTALSQTFPDIKNLALDGNRLADMKSVEGWKHRFRLLENLTFAGNPIVNLPDYRREMIRRYPRLTMLDGVPVDRPKIGAVAGPVQNPSTAVDEKGKAILPLPTKGSLVEDPTPNAFLMAFFQKFFESFDNDRQWAVNYLYTSGSKFSLSVNTSAPRVEAQKNERQYWDVYIPKSRNMKRLHEGQDEVTRLAVGQKEILELWNELPPTKHNMTDSSLWCFDVFPTEVAPGIPGIFACVHGEFDEMNATSGTVMKRSFDRSFMLCQITLEDGSPSIQVVSDMLVIRSHAGNEAWTPTPAAAAAIPTPAIDDEKRQKAQVLAKKSGLTVEAATVCLEGTGWDLAQGWEQFAFCHRNRLLDASNFSGDPPEIVVEQISIEQFNAQQQQQAQAQAQQQAQPTVGAGTTTGGEEEL